MLTCEEYQQLDELLQAQILWIDGAYLMMRTTPRLRVELYSLYHFYVEVFYDQRTEDPLYIKSFERTDYLEPYLEQISIDDIFAPTKNS